METFLLILSYTRQIVALMGVFILIVGVFYSFAQFLTGLFQGKDESLSVDHIRLLLGRNIILGLEFIVAADIIESIVRPDYYELGILAVLVVIRTILSYFLSKELHGLTPEERRKLR